MKTNKNTMNIRSPFAITLAALLLSPCASHAVRPPAPLLGDGQTWCRTDMISDPQAIFVIPDAPRPAYLKTVADPVFGTKITRITGDPGTAIVTRAGQRIGTWGDVVKHHYSKDQPWNADESLLHLPRNTNGSPSDLFLDGQTCEVLFSREVPGRDNRWHPTKPNLKIYIDDNQIGYFDVYSGAKSVVRTFSEYSRLDLGPWEGNVSFDGRIAAFNATRKQGGYDVFAYDLVSNVKYPAKDLGAIRVNWVSISPGGQFVVIKYSDTDTEVFDLNMRFVTRFGVNQSHYDLGVDENGDDVAVGVSKTRPYSGLLIKHRLRDAALTVLTTGGYAVHTSARNSLQPGWCYSSFHPARARYRGEIVGIKMDGTETVRRFCHHHNNQTVRDYLAEVWPVPSHDGTRVIFASNWGGASGRPVCTYLADTRVPCSDSRLTAPDGLRIIQ